MGGKRILGMPLPVVLGVIAAGLVLGIYLRRRGGGSTIAPATSYPTTLPSTGGSIDNGVAGGGLGPAAGTGVDPAVFSEWVAATEGVQANIGTLTDAIGQLVYNIPSSGGSGSSGSGKDPYWAPSNANVPLGTATPDMPLPKPAAPRLPRQVTAKAPIHYFTYRNDKTLVGLLRGGKTLHFAASKGYYAA